MAEIVNLHKARKNAARRSKDQQAAANRLRSGVSKAQRSLHAERTAKAERDLEQHRIGEDSE